MDVELGGLNVYSEYVRHSFRLRSRLGKEHIGISRLELSLWREYEGVRLNLLN